MTNRVHRLQAALDEDLLRVSFFQCQKDRRKLQNFHQLLRLLRSALVKFPYQGVGSLEH